MKKTAVVYATRHGSTQRYAEWIAADCAADLFEVKTAVIDDLLQYETVIYGGCVYAGSIDGIDFIKNNLKLLREKQVRIFVFAVGLTPPGNEKAFEEVLVRNFTEEEKKDVLFYHFLGALDYKKMNLMQRGMLYILKKSITSKAESDRSQLERYLLQSYGGEVDFTNHQYTQPLVAAVLDAGHGQ